MQTSSVLLIMNRSFESFLSVLFLATDDVSNYNSICSYVITYCTKIMFDLSHPGDAQIFAGLVCSLLQQDDETAVACMLACYRCFVFFSGRPYECTCRYKILYISRHPAICHG